MAFVYVFMSYKYKQMIEEVEENVKEKEVKKVKAKDDMLV